MYKSVSAVGVNRGRGGGEGSGQRGGKKKVKKTGEMVLFRRKCCGRESKRVTTYAEFNTDKV